MTAAWTQPNFPAAPNQHHSFVTCPGEPPNTVPSPLPGPSTHIHSKTACRGFKSFCPCQKRRYCFCSGAVFCHWAERLGNEARLRPAQCVSWGERAPVALCREPTEAAAETSPSAPAKKERQAPACLSFFVVTGGEASARGACRASPPKRRLWRMQRGGDGAAVGDWQGGPAAADRAGHRKRACEASSSPSLHFRHAMEEFPPFSSLSWVFSPGFIPPQPLLPSPAPRTHPVSPFSGFSGCVSLFLPFFDPQNFWAGFCSLCRYVSQIEAVGDAM